jgi:hypothetical protein
MSKSSPSSSSSSKYANITLNEELKLLGHEIDKQITKKTNEILELIKEFLGNSIDKLEFYSKLNEVSNTTMGDLTLITKKLMKRYKYEANPNQKDFMRMKHLQFPTNSRDLGESNFTMHCNDKSNNYCLTNL